VFPQLNYDRFLLEYDTARAGGFEPLRFVPSRQRNQLADQRRKLELLVDTARKVWGTDPGGK